jgi:hypothetical protein
MTREEYVTWSEYRQASFTYRKGKRFREWAGFGIVTDSKPSDDIVDILGFLTFEMVQTLTENALKVKEQEDLFKAQSGSDNVRAGSKKRKLTQGLFDPPNEGTTPIDPRHVMEAFRRLQQRPKKSRAMLNGTRLAPHTTLNIVSLTVRDIVVGNAPLTLASSFNSISPLLWLLGDRNIGYDPRIGRGTSWVSMVDIAVKVTLCRYFARLYSEEFRIGRFAGIRDQNWYRFLMPHSLARA